VAEWHIREELFERFLRTEVSREEGGLVVRHLLSSCPQCSETAHRLTSVLGLWEGLQSDGQVDWDHAYEEVLRRALAFANQQERRLAVEKLRGWSQWAQLEPMTPHLRLVMVKANKSFHTWGLYDRLLEASRWHLRIDPAVSVDVLRLAIVVAERLNPEEIGAERLADLQAGVWAALGNALRLAADFAGSCQAFAAARKLLGQGSGDPAEEGNLLSLEGSYLKDLGQFEAAEAALRSALRCFQQAGDVHRQGRVMLKLGEAVGQIDPARGLRHLERAVALIDPEREPRLALCAEHDLAWYLNDNGQTDEALATLERARPLYQQFPDKWTQLRLLWLEGRIAYRRGDFIQAESLLGQVWDEFRLRNLNHELVLVSIDLAQALTGKGELSRAAQLAADCHAIMSQWALHNDALAAWIVFRDALAGQGVQSGLFHQMESYFRRHWLTPARFAPSF
jgi:tetratricopeptide (TPR) repeat protein